MIKNFFGMNYGDSLDDDLYKWEEQAKIQSMVNFRDFHLQMIDKYQSNKKLK